jgi:hypothetical protein
MVCQRCNPCMVITDMLPTHTVTKLAISQHLLCLARTIPHLAVGLCIPIPAHTSSPLTQT